VLTVELLVEFPVSALALEPLVILLELGAAVLLELEAAVLLPALAVAFPVGTEAGAVVLFVELPLESAITLDALPVLLELGATVLLPEVAVAFPAVDGVLVLLVEFPESALPVLFELGATVLLPTVEVAFSAADAAGPLVLSGIARIRHQTRSIACAV